jgi:hypothetical protein
LGIDVPAWAKITGRHITTHNGKDTHVDRGNIFLGEAIPMQGVDHLFNSLKTLLIFAKKLLYDAARIDHYKIE